MGHPAIILPETHSAPKTGESRLGHTALDPHQLAKARSRVTFLSILFTAMSVVAIGIEKTLYQSDAADLTPVFGFNVVTSLLLLIASRTRRLSDKVVLNLGLAYEVLMCLTVSMGFLLDQYHNTGTFPGVTWICIVLVAYPLVIPTPPKQTLLAACSAAAMAPLSLYILQSVAWVTTQPFDYVHVSISPAFCVVFAVLGSHVIYGLNAEVSRARRMGSYQLVELLGQGGMGEVWRAKHRFLARPAAVKLVRPEIAKAHSRLENERLHERFKREAQVIAGLESPHTVGLFDFGITENGVFYYVMELLNGLDLETLINHNGPLRPGRTAHILLQVCHSLREAHDQGMVHRDIKPSNVVLCCQRAGDYDVAKVLDFGLVALRPEAQVKDARLTADGLLTGTPAFIAPEAVTGDLVDARADIYALGCVAYWLLTGKLVFKASTRVKTALAHVSQSPIPPSRRTEIAIPPALERLILACLEKDPDRRPQSAQTLADELRALDLSSQWTQRQAKEWWALHDPKTTQESSSARVPVA